MARPPRIDVPGTLYHVIARGNQRRHIFRDEADYQRYTELLAGYQQRHGFTLYAYVLMPNHLHLLVSPQRLSLAKTMQGLQQSFTQYFNARHHSVGHCFQGRYKAILCDADSYLLELVRYIHLNPVRAGLTDTPETYPWSSHRLYRAGHDGDGVAVEFVLQQFAPMRERAIAAYQSFVHDGLPQGHRDDLYEVVSRQILGNDQFVERVERRAPRRERKVPVEIDLEIISRRIARVLGVSDAQLHDRGRSRHAALARAVVAYVTREEGSLSLAAIAAYFGRDSSTLTTALQRLEARLDHDPQFAITVEHLRHSVRRKAGRKRRKQIIKA